MPLTKAESDEGFQKKDKRDYGNNYYQGGQQGRPAPNESMSTPETEGENDNAEASE